MHHNWCVYLKFKAPICIGAYSMLIRLRVLCCSEYDRSWGRIIFCIPSISQIDPVIWWSNMWEVLGHKINAYINRSCAVHVFPMQWYEIIGRFSLRLEGHPRMFSWGHKSDEVVSMIINQRYHWYYKSEIYFWHEHGQDNETFQSATMIYFNFFPCRIMHFLKYW